jgi:hypothetical protein
MIVTVKEDYDKQRGVNLPMFSRAGKGTSQQHFCFCSG